MSSLQMAMLTSLSVPKYGYSVRFNEAVVPNMGRSATGVRGVNLREGDKVVGAKCRYRSG